LIAAIVLAAGKSERMGQPKALLIYHGRTFLEQILGTIRESSIESTVVVLGHDRESIESSVSLGVSVFNEDYEKGMTTSFQAGIRALAPEVDGAVIFLVDHPVVDPQTVDLLISKFLPGRIVLPLHKGRRGHPVLFSREVLEEILELSPTSGANVVVRRSQERITEVEVSQPGILVDIDTPENFERLKASRPNPK
jgi:molybdenum cofactor cytidylyltransferase